MESLSKNFTLEELTESITAANRKIDNTPNPSIKTNLKKLCTDVLQPIRDKYRHPIIITSGYRCPALNSAVGGAKTSQHMTGCAADIKCTATSKAYLFNLIKDMMAKGEIRVGQLIWEYGTHKEPNWIHVSLPYSKVNNILYLYNKK
jgi:uncharacterized protein YcbK (DUF882 family)